MAAKILVNGVILATSRRLILDNGVKIWHHVFVRKKHRRTLETIFARPTSANIRWSDIESLFIALGAEIEERSGSRIAVIFPGHTPAILHRPHPSPMADKGAVATVRTWLDSLGYKP